MGGWEEEDVPDVVEESVVEEDGVLRDDSNQGCEERRGV